MVGTASALRQLMARLVSRAAADGRELWSDQSELHALLLECGLYDNGSCRGDDGMPRVVVDRHADVFATVTSYVFSLEMLGTRLYDRDTGEPTAVLSIEQPHGRLVPPR